jgi:hypothetical protein
VRLERLFLPARYRGAFVDWAPEPVHSMTRRGEKRLCHLNYQLVGRPGTRGVFLTSDRLFILTRDEAGKWARGVGWAPGDIEIVGTVVDSPCRDLAVIARWASDAREEPIRVAYLLRPVQSKSGLRGARWMAELLSNTLGSPPFSDDITRDGPVWSLLSAATANQVAFEEAAGAATPQGG